jgi:hypothetical protein
MELGPAISHNEVAELRVLLTVEKLLKNSTAHRRTLDG